MEAVRKKIVKRQVLQAESVDLSANYNYSGKIYKATRKVVKLATPEMFPYISSYKPYKFGT